MNWNKTVENETWIPIVTGALGTVTKGLVKGLEYCEESKRFEETQTPVRNHQIRLVWKTQNNNNNNNNSIDDYLLFNKYIDVRCPWCNGYRRMKWTRRYEFKCWTRLIAFHIALIPLGKIWIQLFSLQGEFQPWIQTCKTPLKNWPCVISCPSGGVDKYG